MRVAIVSDIHGNLTAFRAVLADLRQTSPDLVLHGGDLVHSGSSPAEVIEAVRELGWGGVLGNTDEMLFSPESAQVPPAFSGIVAEMAAFTREQLGEERLAWLATLPLQQVFPEFALVHASPGDLWRAPLPAAEDAELERVYAPLERPLAVYAHIHRPFVRRIGTLAVANTGSVSLPHDGDPRASYLLIEDGVPQTRRVEYDTEAEAAAVDRSGLPYGDWVARMLRKGSFDAL